MATADSIQSDAKAFLNDMVSQMRSTVSSLEQLAKFNTGTYGWAYTPPNAGASSAIANAVSTLNTDAVRPDGFATDQFAGIAQPDTSLLDGIVVTAPMFDNIPDFTLVAPVITMPTPPDATIPGDPGAVPTFNNVATPDAPTITMPTLPALANIDIPAAPSLSLPTLDYMAPASDVTDPTYVFNYSETPYQSALLDELKAKLLNDMQNGGYGIEPEDERRLWERARERELLNAETAIQEATRQAAARGFMLPPGALNTAVEKAQQAALEKNSSLSRDIMVKKADLYVENRKFTIQMSKDVEQMLISAAGYVAERALNAAKATAEVGINLFNAQLSRARVRIEASNQMLQLYEVKLKAAFSHIEAFKAQLEGAKLTAEVQSRQVEVFRAQLAGVESLVNVYRTQMDAAKISTELELAKLSAFRERVGAYVAQVQAKSAQFGMFESQIKGEIAKIQAFQSQVSAYGATVDAYKAKAAVKEIEFKAQVQTSEVKIAKVNADLERYKAEVSAANAKIQGLTSQYEANIKAWLSKHELAAKLADTAIKDAEVLNQYYIGNANAFASFVSANLNGSANVARARGDMVRGAGELYATAAQGIASQVSGLTAQITSQ